MILVLPWDTWPWQDVVVFYMVIAMVFPGKIPKDDR